MKLGKRTIISIVFALVIALCIIGYLFINNSSNEIPDTSSQVPRNCTTYGGRVEKQCAEDYEGLSRDETIPKAKKNGLTPKIVKLDGKDQGYNNAGSTPLYLEVENGTVTKAFFIEIQPSNE